MPTRTSSEETAGTITTVEAITINSGKFPLRIKFQSEGQLPEPQKLQLSWYNSDKTHVGFNGVDALKQYIKTGGLSIRLPRTIPLNGAETHFDSVETLLTELEHLLGKPRPRIEMPSNAATVAGKEQGALAAK